MPTMRRVSLLAQAAIGLGIRTRPSNDCITSRVGSCSQRGTDAGIICTAHRAVNYRQLAHWARLIVDTRNAMAGVKTRPGQVWKA